MPLRVSRLYTASAIERQGWSPILYTRPSGRSLRTILGRTAHSKPDLDIVRAALERAGSRAAQTLMIGDTPYDIEAARRAGIAAIALRCGGHWSDEGLGSAIAIFDDPAARLDQWQRACAMTVRSMFFTDCQPRPS